MYHEASCLSLQSCCGKLPTASQEVTSLQLPVTLRQFAGQHERAKKTYLRSQGPLTLRHAICTFVQSLWDMLWLCSGSHVFMRKERKVPGKKNGNDLVRHRRVSEWVVLSYRWSGYAVQAKQHQVQYNIAPPCNVQHLAMHDCSGQCRKT